MPAVASSSPDIAAPKEPAAEFLVTAIGSCRVAGPLRHTPEAMGYSYNSNGVYGYCHSSAEALQQLRVLQGEIAIPQELAPLIAPSGLRQAVHTPSDMYVVEICSGKLLSSCGFEVQLNYVTRHFEDFFSVRERTRSFWQLARTGTRADMKAFLLDQRAYWALDESDRALLEDMRLAMATPDQLAADLSAIAARVPQVLFVTHFNVARPDGSQLRSRALFVEMVTDVLRELRLPFFDPSDYVQAFGTAGALEPGGRSFTHYTPEFERVLQDNWLRRYIGPAMRRRQPSPRSAPMPAPAVAIS